MQSFWPSYELKAQIFSFFLATSLLTPLPATANTLDLSANKIEYLKTSQISQAKTKHENLIQVPVIQPLAQYLVTEGIVQEIPTIANGLEFFQKERFKEALKEFEKVIEKNPQDGQAYYYMGMTYTKLEQFERAVAAFKKALELAPDLKEIYLTLGIVYYKTQAFDLAMDAFQSAIKSEPNNGSAYFFMGLTLYVLSQHNDSLFYFDKAKNLDSEFAQLAVYYKGLANYKMGNREHAKELLSDAVNLDSASEIAQEATRFIDIIEKQKKEAGKRWRASASVGWEWNDNITRTEEDTVSNKEDMSLIFEAGGEYTLWKSPKLVIEGGYNFYQSLFNEVKEFDFQSHTGSVSASRDFNDWDIGLDYSYSYSFLDRESFLGIHTAFSKFGFSLLPNLYTTASYRFQDKVFFTDADRNGINHSIGVLHFLFFMNNKTFWSLGYRFSDENTQSLEFDYAEHGVNTTFKFPAPLKSSLHFYYEFNVRDYKNITQSIGEERRDDKQTFKVSLFIPLKWGLTLNANYRYIESTSNLSSVDYSENAVFVGLDLNI